MKKIDLPHYKRIRKAYSHMKDRCYNTKDKEYSWYGGRGITLCDEWLSDFMNFYNWSINNGYQDNLTIDRIDNNKGYSPSNCRWATKKQQARNTRRNRLIKINGEIKCLAEWCEIFNLKYHTVKRRLYRGWEVKKAFEIEK